MILTVFLALLSAFVIQSVRVARRDRELASLRVLLGDYLRAGDRMEWSERMYAKGHVSKAAVNSEILGFRKAGFTLLRSAPRALTGVGR